MPSDDGFRFPELLRDAGLSRPVVLMHSVDDGIKSSRRCLERGVRRLIPKGLHKDELLTAVPKVYAGQQCWGGVESSDTEAE